MVTARIFSIDCSIGYTDSPRYDIILWKVRNVGAVAEQKTWYVDKFKIEGCLFMKIHSFMDRTILSIIWYKEINVLQ